MRLPGVSGVRVHRFAARNRWAGGDSGAGISPGSVPECTVSVLRTAKGPDQGLYWEEDGFLLLYKRLEAGRFQWPRDGEEAKQITAQQYRWLMEGLEIEQAKANRPVTGVSTV